MANSCASSPTFVSLFFSPNPTSISHPRQLALPSPAPAPFRKLSHSTYDLRTAAYSSSQAPETSSRRGFWSIRDDLEIPASPYLPTYAATGQMKARPPSPVVTQQLQRVVTQLLQHRIVRCGGPVDDNLANTIVSQLLYLDTLDPKKDIIMYINCPGGSITAGMAIFDMMRHVRADVSTVCVGLAASIGAFLLSAGTKGKRFSMPSTRIMIHQPLGGVQGSESEIDIQTNELMHHKANLNAHLALHTGQNLDKLYADTERDYFMSPKEAIAYGLIDGLVANPLKALQPLEASAEQK